MTKKTSTSATVFRAIDAIIAQGEKDRRVPRAELIKALQPHEYAVASPDVLDYAQHQIIALEARLTRTVSRRTEDMMSTAGRGEEVMILRSDLDEACPPVGFVEFGSERRDLYHNGALGYYFRDPVDGYNTLSLPGGGEFELRRRSRIVTDGRKIEIAEVIGVPRDLDLGRLTRNGVKAQRLTSTIK